MAGRGIEPGTSGSLVRRATYCATWPGNVFTRHVKRISQSNRPLGGAHFSMEQEVSLEKIIVDGYRAVGS